jgi:hypothetical protein
MLLPISSTATVSAADMQAAVRRLLTTKPSVLVVAPKAAQ